MSQSANPHDNPELFEAAALGRQIDQFWDSQVGQYLLKRCLEEYNAALEKFLGCDPTDLKTVVECQSGMLRSGGFRLWLSQGIENGIQAERIIEGQDDEDQS